jgi:hypothetical protein
LVTRARKIVEKFSFRHARLILHDLVLLQTPGNTCRLGKKLADIVTIRTDYFVSSERTPFRSKPYVSWNEIGSLSRDFFADLLLIKRKGSDPYAALLHANPLDVRLVVVAGKPVYGDRDLMEKLLPQAILEPLTICRKDTAKVLFLGAEASQGGLKKTWHETEEQLALALRQWNIPLADLAEDSDCGK